MKINWFLTISIIIAFTGCRTAREVQSSNIEKKSESVQIITNEKIISDVPVTISPALQLSQSVGRDSSTLETDYAVSTAVWDGVKLWHDIRNKPLFSVTVPKGRIDTKQIVSQENSTSDKEKEYVYIKKEKYRILNSFFYWTGVIAIIGIIILFVIKRFLIIQIKWQKN